ncbi:zinc-dependent alcohol dehydrogenase [Brevibacterium luteolum]|uniref:Zinc-binding alcohol dehydrogenase n=1 Tax=Brevibacterium luteolum TaxID=199591 RepID=A0A6G8KYM8_9MICO|nr:zinc-binding alcohol dehydrogenase [Brevibacterium luteolum]QIN29902.1 zinc-binding alcohol dehydrogenase [Brevibacterium luteolum]
MAWEFWIEEARRGRWREVEEPHAGGEQLRVRTTASAISRGTERLVWEGRVPDSVAGLMAAPAQRGTFPFPVSYGYLAVGIIDEGPTDQLGQRIFGLLPHHTHHIVTPADIHPVPEAVPTSRALLAGAAETGINILWQAPPRFGDRVAIIGAGMIGTSTALLADRMGLSRLEVIDTDAARREMLTGLGLATATPDEASGDCDIVIHTSGTEAGLTTALALTGDDGTVVEASWYGTDAPRVPLGADFHARRLSIIASQVGQVAAGQRARRTRAQRLGQALHALHDERFDALITGSTDWSELPVVMDRVLTDPASLCHIVDYRSLPG